MCVFSCFLLPWTSTAKIFIALLSDTPHQAFLCFVHFNTKNVFKKKWKEEKMTRIFCGTWRRNKRTLKWNWMTAMMVKCLLLWQSVALPFLIINSSMVNFVRILLRSLAVLYKLCAVKHLCVCMPYKFLEMTQAAFYVRLWSCFTPQVCRGSKCFDNTTLW